MKILTTDRMLQIEQECAELGLSPGMLTENAGKAVAEKVTEIMGNVDKQSIVFLIGPGNNGSDGLATARYLHDRGAGVIIYLCEERTENGPILEVMKERGITCIEAANDENLDGLEQLLSSANAVVDAIFGAGKTHMLRALTPQILGRVNRARKKQPGLRIIALDLPSGLNADTGAIDSACLYADNTITLGAPKPGLFNLPGVERVGKIAVADIGIPPHLLDVGNMDLITSNWAKAVLPVRPIEADKESFGRVLIVAGSTNYVGAAYLACSGAIRAGAGSATVATPASLHPILASRLAEVTFLPLPESHRGIISPAAARFIYRELSRCNVLLIGCGLGPGQAVKSFVRAALFRMKPELPLVIDADALNTLAGIPNWWQQLASDAILTPTPEEMAGLLGLTADVVQSSRIGNARQVALEWQKTVVLKGAYTVIAAPDGRVRVSAIANPGLASAGTGTVLSGVIAGMVAQGLSLFDAAALGVFLFGEAAEIVKDRLGDTGMIATDLPPVLPQAIKRLKES